MNDIVKRAFHWRGWMLPVVVMPPVVSLFLVNWKIGIVWIAYVLMSVRRG